MENWIYCPQTRPSVNTSHWNWMNHCDRHWPANGFCSYDILEVLFQIRLSYSTREVRHKEKNLPLANGLLSQPSPLMWYAGLSFITLIQISHLLSSVIFKALDWFGLWGPYFAFIWIKMYGYIVWIYEL